MSSENTVMIVHAKPERKVIKPGVRMLNKIPESILKDENIKEAISVLPTNYNFEIHKTIWRIKQLEAKRVALQMPEGLLLFATTIADIIERFTGADSVIMGDVTYGACCIDDFTASSLQVDLLVHYGHSCLIPIDRTSKLKILYVFVDIKIDTSHFIETIKCNFDKNIRLCFVSTIQFVMTLQSVATELQGCGYTVKIPQLKPLSPGEILGCTAPVVGCVDAVIYLGDGRFHLEAAMIANPGIKMYRYDPYEKAFTQEFYEHNEMKKNRKQAIDIAKDGGRFGLILGTLGRQGSLKVLKYMQEKFKNNSKQTVIILLSEIFPDRLKLFTDLDAFIQTSCPRLSIDWGTAFSKPLLTPYEASVVIGEAQWSEGTEEFRYPMDFYANTSLGPWTPNHKERSYLKPCCGKCANT